MAEEMWMYQAVVVTPLGRTASLLILMRASDPDEVQRRSSERASELNLVQIEAELGKLSEKPFVSSPMIDEILRQVEAHGIGHHLEVF